MVIGKNKDSVNCTKIALHEKGEYSISLCYRSRAAENMPYKHWSLVLVNTTNITNVTNVTQVDSYIDIALSTGGVK